MKQSKCLQELKFENEEIQLGNNNSDNNLLPLLVFARVANPDMHVLVTSITLKLT